MVGCGLLCVGFGFGVCVLVCCVVGFLGRVML